MTVPDHSSSSERFFTGTGRRSFLQSLLKWEAVAGRGHLPWRACGDAYRVWLSEIMLQQTTVAAVIPYYERFLARFPRVQDLAAAEETEVLRLWEGLGYYRRARNLHAAAKVVARDYGGLFPQSLTELLKLPGIGRYTAGAIASFAYDQPAPIVEANTQRLYARLLAEDRELTTTAALSRLWQLAEDMVTSPATARRTSTATTLSPGRINQALMDLGATVCTPQAPDCDRCPVARWCRAWAAGLQNELPRSGKKLVLTDVTDVTIAILDRGRYLLRRRQNDERWAGLWDFPRYTLADCENPSAVLKEGVERQTGLRIEPVGPLTEFKHGVTRYRITLRCFAGQVTGGVLREDGDLAWASPAEFEAYPLSVTGRKLARWLQKDAEGLGLFREES